MTIPVSNVEVVSDTFGSWVQKTNQIAGIITANAVTVDVTSSGGLSTGNGFVNGIFGACTLVASTLRGGNVATSGPLNISSNVSIDGSLSVNGTVSFQNFVLASDLIPTPNNTWRVGIPGNVWSAGYFTNTYSNTVHAGGFVINTSGFSGTSNNASHLGTVPAASYVTVTNAHTLAGVITHNANLVLSSGLVAGGNTGTSGYFLKSTGTGVAWDVPSVANTQPGGIDSSVQFNDANTLNGLSTFTFNKNNGELAVPTTVRIGNSTVYATINSTAFDGSVNASSINAGTLANTRLSGTYNITSNNASHLGGVISTSYVNTTGSYTITGVHTMNANLVLGSRIIAAGGPGVTGQVLKSTGSGVEWGEVVVGVSAAAGANTQVQFNDSTSLGGDSGLTYDKINDILNVSNAIVIGTGGTTTTINSTAFSGTAATANNATNLGGQSASYYRDAGNMNAGTLANTRLSGTYNILANNATLLSGQDSAYYTNIPARLGYFPVNKAGDTMTGNLAITQTGTTHLAVGSGENGEKRLRLWNSNTNAYYYVSSTGGQIGLYDATATLTRYYTDSSGNMTVTGTFTSGSQDASNIKTGVMATARLASTGTAGSTTFLRGDQSWSTAVTSVTGGNGLSGGTITGTGTFTVQPANGSIIVGAGGIAVNSAYIATLAVTSVTAGTGLTGGTITGTGTIALANVGVGATLTGGISAITYDGYGRVTSATGSAGYVTSSGVTSIAAGNGLDGGTVTSTGTFSVKPANGSIIVSASGIAVNAAYISSLIPSYSGVDTFRTTLSGLTPSTATSGTVTLAGTLGVSSGGTGATTASGARANLQAVYTGGDTVTGKLIFTANPGIYMNSSSFRISQDNTNTPGNSVESGESHIGGAWQHNTQGSTIYIARSQFAAIRLAQRTSGDDLMNFYYNNGSSSSLVGAISLSGTSGIAISYSSDYRLKEDLKPIANALDNVVQTPVYDFRWKKAPDERSMGFLAHEAQAIVPEAVRGVKDGEQMQAMDYTKMVPMLWAAVQELSAKVKDLEAQLNSQ